MPFAESTSARPLDATSARPLPWKGRLPPSTTAPHRLPTAWSVRSPPATTRTAPSKAVSVPASIPAVIAEQPDRGPAAAAKHEHTPGKRILGEFLLAESRQRIDALSSIDCLDGHQHAHLRRDLNHPSVSRHACSKVVQSGGAAAFHWMRILLPPGDSNSIAHSSSGARDGATNSTNAGLVAFRRKVGDPPRRFFSLV